MCIIPNGPGYEYRWIQDRGRQPLERNDRGLLAQTPTADSDPYGIVYDPFGGDLWFTEDGGDKIGRIDPETEAIAEYTVPTAKSEPEEITVDPSGNVWFTESNADQIGTLCPNAPGSIRNTPFQVLLRASYPTRVGTYGYRRTSPAPLSR